MTDDTEYLFALTLTTCACWIKNSHNGKYRQLVQIFEFGENSFLASHSLSNRVVEEWTAIDENHKFYREHEFLLSRLPTRPQLRQRPTSTETGTGDILKKNKSELSAESIVRHIRMVSTPISDLCIKKFCEKIKRNCEAKFVFVVYLSESGIKTLSEILSDHLLPVDQLQPIRLEEKMESNYDVPREPRPVSGLRDSCDQIKNILSETLQTTKRRSRENESRTSTGSRK